MQPVQLVQPHDAAGILPKYSAQSSEATVAGVHRVRTPGALGGCEGDTGDTLKILKEVEVGFIWL